MKPAQIEELQYFYLKYIHEMNKVKVLLKDAISLKRHIDCLESGNITEFDLLFETTFKHSRQIRGFSLQNT